jgi:hypothetical protein
MDSILVLAEMNDHHPVLAAIILGLERIARAARGIGKFVRSTAYFHLVGRVERLDILTKWKR